jgi:hypothetical protein
MQGEANAEFMVCARTDVPDLLQVVDIAKRAALASELVEAFNPFHPLPEFSCAVCACVIRSSSGMVMGHRRDCTLDAFLTSVGLDTWEKREAARKETRQ